MKEELFKNYTLGTHRTVAPAETLARIQPHLASMGVTRCADVSGLDRLGIPVYCAIRPCSRDLQVANGKGLTVTDAKVSALMEAIELFHADHPAVEFRRQSRSSLEREGRPVIAPSILPDYKRENYFSDDFSTDWIVAEDLLMNQEVWVPASMAYVCNPRLCTFSSNGLASGNHLVEATLHAIYEVVERDAVSGLNVDGQLYLSPQTCRFIDLRTVSDGPVSALNHMLREAEIKLLLIWVRSPIPVHTFMAVFIDKKSFGNSSLVNIGYGSHLSLSVAATRAITEAAQSRLTFIHGSRQDLKTETYQHTHESVYRFFDAIEAMTPWQTLNETVGESLFEDYQYVLRSLSEAGYEHAFRVDMSGLVPDISVTKVVIPGMKMIASLFQ
ncbi:MAG TPA: YcaO-like family protein [Pyrinomonadaceae bacterium]|jgi:ribosomal protein S12 methylthiotransferase accessory factor